MSSDGNRWTLVAVVLVGACMLGCDEGAPRHRGEPPPPPVEPPDAGPPYMGICGTVTCPRPGPLNTPGCCTRPGTGQPGHKLENVGRAPNLCGTDIGAIAPSLAGICLQLSQPGLIDDECPAEISIRGGDPRPGCCTPDGFCGSLDVFVPLGCFYATGLKGIRCTPGPGRDGGTVTGPDEDAGPDGGGSDVDAGR